MAFNALATATIFQTTLDQIATQEALTGWMEANAGIAAISSLIFGLYFIVQLPRG